MNKQELIKIMESLVIMYSNEGECPNVETYNAYVNSLAWIKKLDEPQQPVIPQYVADLVDWTVRANGAPCDVIREFKTKTPDTVNLPGTLELEKLDEYFKKAHHRYDFEKACFVGYEVEKEPLYYVYFPEITASPGIEEAYLMKTRNGVGLADNNDFDDMKFTEREIKAIDKRYWAFAVPVEEVSEG
ncbi:DUF1642 domain-containing protein [Enterococcus sp. DIV0996a]|uniref:DUF1642 domain-containing protein n=1 Tax=Enterococcus sp. DIV0996a TaxID=2774790 RepID=UPI003F22A8A4